MSALSSLLVRDRVVSVRQVEEALERQVLEDIGLEDVLLEEDQVAENVLAAYRAATFGLLPGTRQEVMQAPADVARRLPRDLAIRHRVIPLAGDGGAMVLATAWPPEAAVREELSAALGAEVTFRVILPIRVAAGLSHHYGVELDGRQRRLIDSLRGRSAGAVPYVAPPRMSTSPSSPTPVHGIPAPTQSMRPTSGPPSKPAMSPSESWPPAVGEGADEALSRRRRRTASMRGPLPVDVAAYRLEGAKSRDEVLSIFLAFARQFVDYAALFVVQGDLASGRQAVGAGHDTDYVQRLAIPLDVPGAFATAHDTAQAAVVNLLEDDLDAIVAKDLARESFQPALIAPIVLRRRPVLLVYADRKGEDFVLADLPELLGMIHRVGDALERLIVSQKGGVPAGILRGVPSHRPSASPSEASSPRPPSSVPPGVLPSEPPSTPAMRPPGHPPAIQAAKPSGREGLPFSSLRPPEPGPLAVLGVPRDAPSPPQLRYSLAAASPDSGEGPLVAGAPVGAASVTGEESTAADARAPSAPPPEPQGAYERATTARRSLPPGAGTYRGDRSPSDVPTSKDVPARTVPPRTNEPKSPAATPSRRPSRSPSARPDPRREDSLPAHQDVVRVGSTLSSIPPPKPVEEPKVIVNMGARYEALIDDLMSVAPDEVTHLFEAVHREGEAILPALIKWFPGPLWFDRRRAHVRVPPGRDVSAVARAIVTFGDTATPYVASLLEGADAEYRYYAAVLAGEFVHPALLAGWIALLYDHDAGTRRVALSHAPAFRDLGTPFDESWKDVRNQARHPRGDARKQVYALEALGAARDGKAVPDLLGLMDQQGEAVTQAAHKALVVITCQDFGRSSKRWSQWYEKNAGRDRIEWLMDALLHSNVDIRGTAGEELARITSQDFGFVAMSSRSDRERTQQRYREWWIRGGRET